jgi:type VI secretion system secreted protein Hcp
MALNAYLKLTGAKQGIIKGSVVQKGREGKIMVIAVNHEVISPRDSASGMAAGKRQHKPLTITKVLDKSSPLLYKSLVTNENLTEFILEFWSQKQKSTGGAVTGTEKQHYTIKLTNATICGIKFIMLNNKNPELSIFEEYEEVSFTYQKIEWIWVDGGITTIDDLQNKIS